MFAACCPQRSDEREGSALERPMMSGMTKRPLLVAGGFVLVIVTAVAVTLYVTRDEGDRDGGHGRRSAQSGGVHDRPDRGERTAPAATTRRSSI
jgi:hypothetical protein